jgi:hypothetical protein
MRMGPVASMPRFAAAYTIALAALLPCGCSEKPKPSAAAAASIERNDTPEGQLRNVMRRLEDALARAKAAPGLGVKSTRRCTYELIPPAEDGGEYQAKVVIQTLVELEPDDVTPKPVRPGAAQTTPIGETVEHIAEETSSADKQTYTLVYRDRHWELTDPKPADIPATEKLCFEIALSDG